MTVDFEMLCMRTKEAAFVGLEEWDGEFQSDADVVAEVLKRALATTLPRLDQVDGDWVMKMMWQVPDLLIATEYSHDMNVNEATWTAVNVRIGDLIRDHVRERAGELGLDPGGVRI